MAHCITTAVPTGHVYYGASTAIALSLQLTATLRRCLWIAAVVTVLLYY
jgi:hypothetical protein